MGISNLLPLLQPSTERVHISEFRGKTVAVDSYCWLHKGARGCAMKLARGEDTNSYVEYVMKRVRLLLQHNITPIMVYDGRPLPAKLKTEAKRRDAKKLARAQGMECLRLGQSDEAYKYFCQCVEVTPAMALALMKECRKINIDCVVAPYEADAQLAFLSINNLVDLVITEDSDLLAFGCKKVLYKLDQHGLGQLIDSEHIYMSMKMRKTAYTLEKFRHMCILSGCDYLDSLPGIGLKKALKFITMTIETNPDIFLDRLPRYLQMKNLRVTPEYKRNFFIADATFRHQTVFDTKKKQLTSLTPVTLNPEYCINAGEMFDNAQATQLALGNLNPLTMEQIDDWSANNTNTTNHSIWRDGRLPIAQRATLRQLTPSNTALCRPVNNALVQQAQAQSYEKIEQELEFYKSSYPVSSTDTEDDDMPLIESPNLSPVLGNPFFKMKPCRSTPPRDCDRKKVVSRFFHDSIDNNGEPAATASPPLTELEEAPKDLSELPPPESLHALNHQNVVVLDDATSTQSREIELSRCEVGFEDQNVDLNSRPGPSVSQPIRAQSVTEKKIDLKGKSISKIGPKKKILKRTKSLKQTKTFKQTKIMDAFKKMTMTKP